MVRSYHFLNSENKLKQVFETPRKLFVNDTGFIIKTWPAFFLILPVSIDLVHQRDELTNRIRE